MPQLILLGDSVFDNGAYVALGADVGSQLLDSLPVGWRLQVLAEDGATTEDVLRQLERVPSQATHLVLSVGGNDALSDSQLLVAPVSAAFEAFDLLYAATEKFALNYRRVLKRCLEVGRPLTICTIYDGSFEDDSAKRCARIALAAFNDVIVREAGRQQVSVLDLRFVCTEPSDFTRSIEPSRQGGAKISRAIANVLG